MDQGEAYDVCGGRELEEEIGLSAGETLEKLFKIDACPETGEEFVWVYRCWANGPFRLQPAEVDEGAWVSREALGEWIGRTPDDFASGFLLVWERYRQIDPDDE